MKTRTAATIVSFISAALLTFAMLAGVDALASGQPTALVAHASAGSANA